MSAHRAKTRHQATRGVVVTASLCAALMTASCTPTQTDAPHPRGKAAGCTPTPLPEQAIRGCIHARNQASDGTTLIIDVADIRGGPGWIVLHGDDHGEPGRRDGLAHLPEGTATHVLLTASRPLRT